MVAPVRLIDDEHDRHLVEESAGVGVAAAAVVLTDVKDDLVGVSDDLAAFQERRLGSPVGVRDKGLQLHGP